MRRRYIIVATIAALCPGTLSAQDPPTPVDCIVRPDQTVRIGTPVEGVLAEIPVERGDPVRAGTVVARLQSEVEFAQRALAQARAEDRVPEQLADVRVSLAQRQLERVEQLLVRRNISQAQADEARAAFDAARLDAERARVERRLASLELARVDALIAQRTIRSPIDGIVVERSLNVGEYRGEQSYVMTVARLDPLRVEAAVPIARYPSLAVGDTAMVEIDPPVGGSHPATITIIDRVFDPASATFSVRLRLENPDNGLPAGIRCRVRFAAP